MTKPIKKKCPYCGKEFLGVTESQADNNLIIHKISKHKDKVKIIEGK